MSDSQLFIQNQQTTLSGAGASIGDTTITLTSLTQNDGTLITMTDVGTKGFATIEPGNGSQEESITFSGITQNANGTATLTGVKTALTIAPYTETSGLAITHAGGTQFILTNTAAFYNALTGKGNDETITGTWTFTDPAVPRLNTAHTYAGGEEEYLVTKRYVDDIVIAGGVDASTTTKGISKMSVAPAAANNPIAVGDNDGRVPTQGENDALVGNNTDVAVGTGNKMVTQTGLQHSAEVYAASTTGNDTYVVTLSPAPTSYTAGMTIRFKPDTANTGACSLNVNGLGAKAIKKKASADLDDNDIIANQVVEVIYDGTNFQMVGASLISQANITDLTDGGATTLHTHDSYKKLYLANNVTNSLAAETAMVNYTLPGGSLDTNNAVKITIYLDIFRNGADGTSTLKLKYGATTLFTSTIALSLNPRYCDGKLECVIASAGATNSQRSQLFFIGYSGAGTVGSGLSSPTTTLQAFDTKTSSEDSTADKAIQFTTAHSASNGDIQFTINNVIIEAVK
jgi:hypothetical protein